MFQTRGLARLEKKIDPDEAMVWLSKNLVWLDSKEQFEAMRLLVEYTDFAIEMYEKYAQKEPIKYKSLIWSDE